MRAIVAIIISKNHCFLTKPTSMFKRVFIEKEEIVVFIYLTFYQKNTDCLIIGYQELTK